MTDEPINLVDFAAKRNAKTVPVAIAESKEDEPQPNDYDFVLTDGTVYSGTGYLVATSAWVGLTDGDKKMNVIIPMSNLQYVEVSQPQE